MQRYFAKEMQDDCLVLELSDMHHIKNVMRMNKGDKIECIYDKKLYICKILDTNLNKFEIVQTIDEDNELEVERTIAIALVKEQKMDLILIKINKKISLNIKDYIKK